MHGAFAKIVRRSIRGSLGRFLAIIGIVALGCGFFAGLQMSGPTCVRPPTGITTARTCGTSG